MDSLPESVHLWLSTIARQSGWSAAEHAAQRTRLQALWNAQGDEAGSLGRYQLMAELGRGGMARVYRVYDPRLDRVVALKVLHDGADADGAAHFLREARLTARLQHPGVVPVHEIGAFADGRPFFTMQEIRGQTLAAAIARKHTQGVERHRLIEAFGRVCETITYAHAHDIIHCDLKPGNVMVGRYGQTRVLDWGLAASLLEGDRLSAAPQTLGTPGYMAPEQADPTAHLQPTVDVYALGVMLFEVFIGRLPVLGAAEVAQRQGAESDPIPAGLHQTLRRALAVDPDARHPNAGVLWAEVAAWLAGATRRQRAFALVEEADLHRKIADGAASEAKALRRASTTSLRAVPPWAPDEARIDAWRREKEAETLEAQSIRARTDNINALHAALRLWPDLPEATRRLADHYHQEHRSAEQRRDQRAATQLAHQLQTYAQTRYQAYLLGDGALTLHTTPTARLELFRYEEQHRRMHLTPTRSLGEAPVTEVPLPMGSYLVVLTAPGHIPTHYPLHIPRQHRWTGCPPEAVTPTRIVLPPEGAFDPTQEAYVPAGWFLAGALKDARRYWLDGFILQRTPVTHRDYLRFLNALVHDGHAVDALRWAPRSRVEGHLLYAWSPQRAFTLPHNTVWTLDSPVVMVTWSAASAYARWIAAQTGHPWRLPSEWEWEKAARGVDGRRYPWGDHFEFSRCASAMSQPGTRRPWPVGAFPLDESPYRVRDTAGGVQEWCAEVFHPDPPEPNAHLKPTDGDVQDMQLRACRGGSWQDRAERCQLHHRESMPADDRGATLGFRLARSYGTPTDP